MADTETIAKVPIILDWNLYLKNIYHEYNQERKKAGAYLEHD